MVIISTRPVAAIIQAVSPASIAGGAASASAGVAPSPSKEMVVIALLVVMVVPRRATPVAEASVCPLRNDGAQCLQRVAVGLARANAHGAVDAGDENLAVADLSGLGRVGDHLDDLVDLVVVDRDVDPDLGQEVHRVLGAAINLLVALLAAVAFDFGDGHALDASRGERVANILELEWLDDSDDHFHGTSRGMRPPIEPRV